MTITLQTGNRNIIDYSQRELKDLFTTILVSEKIEVVENNRVFCIIDGQHTLLILDISRSSATGINFEYDKNRLVSLKSGFAKVLNIDCTEVDTIAKCGFSAYEECYKAIAIIR